MPATSAEMEHPRVSRNFRSAASLPESGPAVAKERGIKVEGSTRPEGAYESCVSVRKTVAGSAPLAPDPTGMAHHPDQQNAGSMRVLC